LTKLGRDLIDLFRLTKRIAYHCPLEHISDPFFILYEQYKGRVKDIEKYINGILGDEKVSVDIDANKELM
jgi:hypothetical protein